LTWLRCRSRRHLQEPSRAALLACGGKNRRGWEDPRRYAALKVPRSGPFGKPYGSSRTKPPDAQRSFTPRCRGMNCDAITSHTDSVMVQLNGDTQVRHCRVDPMRCRHRKSLSLPVDRRGEADTQQESSRPPGMPVSTIAQTPGPDRVNDRNRMCPNDCRPGHVRSCSARRVLETGICFHSRRTRCAAGHHDLIRTPSG
jgi:hypothetical protein